jgi:hypothetical protein
LSLYGSIGAGKQDVAEFLERQKKVEVDLVEAKYKELLRKTENEYK